MTQRDSEYEALRAALEELRVHDERSAPAFHAVVGRRASRRSPARPRLRHLAIAAGLVVAAGIAYGTVRARGDRLIVPREVVALSTWRPASDALLQTPVRDFLKTPQLGVSLITSSITGELR